jgi:hypothetical protein
VLLITVTFVAATPSNATVIPGVNPEPRRLIGVPGGPTSGDTLRISSIGVVDTGNAVGDSARSHAMSNAPLLAKTLKTTRREIDIARDQLEERDASFN